MKFTEKEFRQALCWGVTNGDFTVRWCGLWLSAADACYRIRKGDFGSLKFYKAAP